MVVGMEPLADKSERMRGNVPTGEGKKDFLATSTLEGSNKAGKETTGGWSPITSEALEEIDDAGMDSYILYSNNGSVTTQHKVEFMGDRWKLILEQNRSELCERFHTSTAKALSLPKDDIFGIFFSTGSLLAQFSVRHSPSMSIKAINEALITHAYEEVWALYYKEEKEPGIPQLLRKDDPLSCSGSTTKIGHDDTIRKLKKDNSMEESCRPSSMSKKTHSDATLKSRSSSNHPFSHRKSFPGKSWATILQEQKSKIIKAIDLDVSDATGISDEIQKKIYTEGEKLIIICTAKPNESMDQSTLSRQLSQHKYPHLWSLYKASDDYNAKQVLNDDESDMERSMKSNKSSFSRGNKNSFRKFNDTQVSPNKKRRTPAVTIAAQRKSLLSGSLPEEKFVPLDTVLPTPESDFVVTQHRIEFDGDGWDVVLEWKREELCKAFDADVCETLKIPRGSVMDAHFVLGSLSVDFGIRHDPSLRKRDLDKLLIECDFDRVWNLYDNRDDHGKKDDVILASKLSTATEDPPVERGGVLPTSVEPLVIEVHGKKLVVTQHRIEFDGDGWDVVLEWKREELCKAFDADVCETLKIPRGSVMDAHFVLGSLSVDFGIRHDPSLRKRDLDKLLIECDFDRVWNLYDNRDDHGKKDDVLLASKLSTATEDPPVERGGVRRNPTSGNLRASAQFSPERSYCTSTGAIVLKPQKIFLGCYKDEDSNAPLESVMEVPNDGDLVVTRHRVRFDGDDWDLVFERKRDALKEAFDADVCDALGIPRGSVVNPKFVLGSLFVEFGVRHLASLSKRDVTKGLERCEFPSVWKLYEPRGTKPTDKVLHATEALAATAAPSTVPQDDMVVTRHRVRFDGDDWDLVLERKRDALKEAFDADVCDALGIPRGSVVNPKFVLGSLSVEFGVCHLASLSKLDVTKGLERCEFPSVWKLYEPRGTKPTDKVLHATEALAATAAPSTVPQDDMVVTRHRVRFDGDDWDLVLERKRDALKEAFDADVCDALGIPRGSVVNPKFVLGSLSVEFGVCHLASLSKRDVAKGLGRCEFPSVWKLYEPRGTKPTDKVLHATEALAATAAPSTVPQDDMVVTRHRVRFDGDDWDLVLERKRDALKEAFDADVCDALGIPRGSVVNPKFVLGSLSVEFGVRHLASLSKRDVAKGLGRCEFPSVWKLYEPRGTKPTDEVLHATEALAATAAPSTVPQDDMVVTRHRVRFDGDDWDLVLERKRDALKEAFDADVCDALGIPRGSVVNPKFVLGSLSVEFGVCHLASLSKRDVAKGLERCEFPSVWKLYEPRQRLVAKKNTMGSMRSESNAGRLEVFRPGSCVLGEHAEKEPSPLQAIMHMPDMDEIVVTHHRVQFDGDDWDLVLERKRDALNEAFDADVCDALGIPRGSVVNPKFVLGSLSVEFGVCHLASLSKRDVAKGLERCEFPSVWKLYEPRQRLVAKKNTMGSMRSESNAGRLEVFRPGSCVLGEHAEKEPSPLQAIMHMPDMDEIVVTHHRVQFDGDDWDLVLERKRDALKEAFDADVCDALGIPRGSVVNPKFVLGSLSVEFGVRHLASLSKRDVAKGLGRCEFPSVWKLYEPRGTKPTDEVLHATEALAATAAPSTVPQDDMVVTRHRVRFDGDDWDLVLERKRDALKEAFDADVCDALGIPRGSVVNPKFVLGSLFVEFGVRHLASLSKRDVAKGLERCEFPSVWKLYEPRQRLVAKEYVMPTVVPLPLSATETILPTLSASEECAAAPLRLQGSERVLPTLSASEECAAAPLRLQGSERVLPTLSASEECAAAPLRLQGSERVLPTLSASEECAAAPLRLQGSERVLPTLSASEECAAAPLRLQGSERVLPTLSASEECAAAPLRLQGSERVLPTLSASEECAAAPLRLQGSERVLPTLSASEECAATPLRLQGSERVLPTLSASEECAAAPLRLQGSERVLPTLRASEECAAAPIRLQGSERVLPTLRASEECAAAPLRLQGSERVLPTVRASEECAAAPIRLQGSERVLPTLRASEECAAAPLRLQGSERVLPTVRASEECAAAPLRLQGSERVLPTVRASEECAAAPIRLQGSERVLPTLSASEECAATPIRLQSSEEILPTLRACEKSYPVEKLFPVGHIPVFPAQPGKKAQPDALRGSNGKGSYERQSVCNDDSTKKKDVSGSIPSKASKVYAAYRVGFVGRGWNVVADGHKTRLKECILRDLLDVGDVIPKSVENVSCSSSGDVVVTVLLEHPVTLSQNDVCRLLDDASFPEMWSLHDEVAALDQPGYVTTFHRVGFMGSEWSSKIQGNVVHAAFVKDVVDVLRVKPEDVRIVAYHVSQNLVIDFYVDHRASLTEASIDEQLDRAPFEWVWEVYRNAQRPSMYELKPLGVPAQPATLPPIRRLAPRTNGVTRLRALRPKARTGYSRPGLPHLQPLNKQREWYGESEGEMYSPQGEYTLSRNHMMELPRIVQTPPLAFHRHPRADFGMAQQQRQVNLSEVNDVLGQQRQRLQHPPHPEDGPDMGLVPLNYELEPVHGEGRRRQPRPFRAKLWRP